MAILSKIRERSLFLIIIIAMALFAFVVGDFFTKGNFGRTKNSIGEINGENITREEFAELVEQQRAQTNNRASQLQSVNAAWDNLVRQKIYEIQLEKSGIVVGQKDVYDEIIKQPFFQNNPQFKNEAGLFDEDKFKEYIATLQDGKEGTEEEKMMWLSWRNYENSIKSNLELRTYNNLITAGLGATLKEGERSYFDTNTKLDLEYVYVPYTSIADSLVNVSDDEIKDYVKSHPDDYRSEASRDISFVKFDIKATPEDEAAIKNDLAKFIHNREEYSEAANSTIEITGMAEAENMEDFFRNNDSDTPLDNKFYFKTNINQEIADTIFSLNIGDVYGPYKEGEFFKLTKVEAVKQLPDSVKARHILIPFLGAMRADPSITRSEEEAKQLADSLLAELKINTSKFENFVSTFSSDQGSINNGGKYDWFTYNRMVPEFRDFTFENNVGDMGVVKTAFGFHIIEIEGQKNLQKAVKLATFSRKIIPSDETENDIFQKAETFASDVTNGKDMTELAEELDLKVQPVIALKAMDERVSTLGNQRQIVTWAFDKSTKEDEVKRFDIENGYAIVKLTAKRKKGLTLGTSRLTIKTKLMNEKKAEMIAEKMTGNSLSDIAGNFDSEVKSSKAVSIGSPVLPGAGRVQDLINTLVILKDNQLYKNIKTQNGVFAVKILKKEEPTALDNYASSTNLILNRLKSKSGKSYEVLKDFADIEDNRATFY